jgi:CRP-like cAMP-binding protein
MKEDVISRLLLCLAPTQKHYDKGSTIFAVNDPVIDICVLLSGSVYITQDDYWGNRRILTYIHPYELFAEAFSCAGLEKFPVSVIAAEVSEILMINHKRMLQTCSTECVFHSVLINNLLRILAMKNLAFVRKMEHLTRHTTREKLLSFLSEQAIKAGRSEFTIPFNRRELADYLSVDRSAMSNELSKMQDENLIRYNRNHFKLL